MKRARGVKKHYLWSDKEIFDQQHTGKLMKHNQLISHL